MSKSATIATSDTGALSSARDSSSDGDADTGIHLGDVAGEGVFDRALVVEHGNDTELVSAQPD